MSIRESHTITIQGDITVQALEEFVAKAKAAGAKPADRVGVTGERGDQRDRIPAALTVTIT